MEIKLKIKKKCHLCDSENVKKYKDWKYGFRNRKYVGAYQGTYYACDNHIPNN